VVISQCHFPVVQGVLLFERTPQFTFYTTNQKLKQALFSKVIKVKEPKIHPIHGCLPLAPFVLEINSNISSSRRIYEFRRKAVVFESNRAFCSGRGGLSCLASACLVTIVMQKIRPLKFVFCFSKVF
jgi:hypothetical protein